MAGETQILLPDIGDFDAVEIIEIAINPGDAVNKEDTLITLESDKATMDIPCPHPGTIKKVLVKIGDKIAEGAPIAIIEEKVEDGPAAKADEEPEPQESAPAAKVDEAPEPQESAPAEPPETAAPASPPPPAPERAAPVSDRSREIYASPAVRRFARELGVDLQVVQGSGRKGRILKEDVKAFTKERMSAPTAAGGFAMPVIPEIDFSKFGEVEIRPLSRIKQIGGQSLHQSWVSSPHVTQFDEADISDLEDFRKLQAEEAKKQGVKLTLLTFLVKAAVKALQQYPEFNSSLRPDGESIVLKKYLHIGIAVNTDSGLMVPVIRDADQKGLLDIAGEIITLSTNARQRKISPEALQGGCFTISSLGGVGGLHFTPIINMPEAAILGVSRAAIKPVYQNGEFIPRLIMPFALSYDHRIIDGVAGAQFTRFLSKVLTDIRHILL